MKIKFYCLIVFLMLITSAMIVPTSSKSNKKNVFYNEENSLIVVLEANDYEIREYDSEHFEIIMDDFGSNLNEGYPMLPMKTFMVGVPPGANVKSIEILHDETEKVTGDYLIRPSPGFTSLNNYLDKPISKNEIYKSDEEYPSSFCEFIGMTQMRKYNIAQIRFSPFNYIPNTEKLILHKKITVKINYEITKKVTDELLSDNVFDDIASSMIVNYDDIKSFYKPIVYKPVLQPYDYVIITTSALQSSLNGFKNFKQSIGHNVNIVTDSWIASQYSGNDIQQKIRNFLSSNYVSWGIQYVLIVGSHASIPMRMCYPDDNNAATDGQRDVPTDYYYADLTGNWDTDSDSLYGESNNDSYDFTPEVIVGRIPVDNPTTVSSICSKIQSFQQAPNTGWKKNALLLGCILKYANEDNSGYARTDGAELMEQCKNNLLSGYSCTTMYESAGLSPTSPGTYSCTMPLTNPNVISQWGGSSGWGIVNWNGHGSATHVARWVWSTDDGDSVPEDQAPAYEISKPAMIQNTDAPSLNDNKPPIVFATSCNTGYPETSNNLGAALLTQGASAYIGASRVSWGTIGWTTPNQGGINSISYYFFDNLVINSQTVGNALYNSKVYYWSNFNYPSWGWVVNANMYDFNLYGDPAMGLAQVTAVNNAPNVPSTPSGPSSGTIGVSSTFSTSATDPDNDNVKYGWDWGDGSAIEWTTYYTSGSAINTPHTYTGQGTYNIKVKAEDTSSAQSSFSSCFSVLVTGPNNPPNTPAKPSGPTTGNVGTSYQFSFTTTDPDNDNVRYGIDWGDGTPVQWTGFYPSGATATKSHIWGSPGSYNVRVKAEDNNAAQSGNSPYATITISGTNNPPNVPNRPEGPTAGIPGVFYNFSVVGSDPDGDKLKYGWDWDGDHTIDQWDDNNGNYYNSNTKVYIEHKYPNTGTYNIFVKAEDEHGAQHVWYSPPLTLVIDINKPPLKPTKPQGPTSGKPNKEYTFETSANDLEGDDVYYWFDWGDGTNSGWVGPYNAGQTGSAKHSYSQKATYQIKVKARDTNFDESIWSDPTSISLPKNKQISRPFGFTFAFGFSVDIYDVEASHVDLEILDKDFYIWGNEMETFNPGVFLRLYDAKGLFSEILPFCFGVCSDYGIIG